MAVAERQQYLTMAVRDHLNAGGKLVHAGETAQTDSLLDDLFGRILGGLYYGLDGFPEQHCFVLPSDEGVDPFSDCLLLADDFTQYYLGAFDRQTVSAARRRRHEAGPLAGDRGRVQRPGDGRNPIDELGAFTVTSDVLPPAQFPQFTPRRDRSTSTQQDHSYRSKATLRWPPYHEDESYMRLGADLRPNRRQRH